MSAKLQAPIPYFGGKARVADAVWERFGDPANYVEPFCGSCSVLLARPSEPRTETVNDVDGMIANFWRAVSKDAAAVAEHADWPVNENDLHAKHAWLVGQKAGLVARLEGDPEFYDAKIAGWWCWGMSTWIGSGFCAGVGPWHVVDGELVNGGKDGVKHQRPQLRNAGMGVNRKLPHIGDAGKGVKRQRPQLRNTGKGVNRQLPHLGNAGRGVNKGGIYELFDALQARLRRVRVCCGDWTRVLGPAVTTKLGLTAVFLDPPYSAEAGRDNTLYAHESKDVAHAVKEWALAHGDDPLFRIALCGYEGEHSMPNTWECLAWKAKGGYAVQGDGSNKNKHRERIWFSPHCIRTELC